MEEEGKAVVRAEARAVAGTVVVRAAAAGKASPGLEVVARDPVETETVAVEAVRQHRPAWVVTQAMVDSSGQSGVPWVAAHTDYT